MTETCEKVYMQSDRREQIWIDKIKEKLKQNISGKTLKIPWLYEKKFESKRLYFIVDLFSQRILFVDFSHKKDQQIIINEIVEQKQNLLEYLRNKG